MEILGHSRIAVTLAIGLDVLARSRLTIADDHTRPEEVTLTAITA
jgi:hypothetical protein